MINKLSFERIKLKGNKTILMVSSSCKELSEMLMFFQELYENPLLRGKYDITHEQINKWWKSIMPGCKYYEVIHGYNFPAKILKDKNFKLGNLKPKEFEFLQLFNDRVTPHRSHYIIGFPDDIDKARRDMVRAHELIHGMYYLLPKYRKAVDKIVIDCLDQNSPITEIAYKAFKSDGLYHPDVFPDELNAYLITDSKEEFFDRFPECLEHQKQYKALRNQLLDCFLDHDNGVIEEYLGE